MEVTFNKYGDKEHLNSINYAGDAENSGSWILEINRSAGEQAVAKTTAVPSTPCPRPNKTTYAVRGIASAQLAPVSAANSVSTS